MQNIADIAETLRPFLSAEREAQRTPFAMRWRERAWLAATDGHTAALIATESESTAFARSDAPPLAGVIDYDYGKLESVGELSLEGEMVLALRELPAAWTTYLAFESGKPVRLSAERVRGKGKREKRTPILRYVDTGWTHELSVPKPVGVNAQYLLRALDLFDATIVDVWRNRTDVTAPWFFTAGSPKIELADRIAIVMPTRV